jgi:hypothetical protein
MKAREIPCSFPGERAGSSSTVGDRSPQRVYAGLTLLPSGPLTSKANSSEDVADAVRHNATELIQTKQSVGITGGIARRLLPYRSRNYTTRPWTGRAFA